LEIIAPWRDGRFRKQFPGRAEMIAYCDKKKIPVQASAKKPYSMDRNLLHISFEAGILEDPWLDAFAPKNKDMFKLSVDPEDAPDRAEYVTLEFGKGNCISVNGERLTPLGVMRALNRLGGKHGVGRVDMVENRYVGMKSRGVYETPGALFCILPSPNGNAHDGSRSDAFARLAHPAVCRAGLLWLLVRSRTARSAGARDGKPEKCHRHGPREALQRQYHGGWPQIAGQSLQSSDRDHGSRPNQSV